MIFREDDARYLTMADGILADEGMEDADDDDDVMEDDSSNSDVDMTAGNGNELVVTRKCDGILDIVLVGEVRWFAIHFCGLFFARSHSRFLVPRRTSGTVRLGITTGSLAAFENGTGSLRSSVFL